MRAPEHLAATVDRGPCEDAALSRCCWAAVQVKPRREALALTNLERQGMTTYCPRVVRLRRVRGKAIEAHEPLFPGYVFVVPDAGRWRSINGTLGVLRVISFGEGPALLPPGFVEALEAMAGEEGAIRFDDELRKGDAVRIVGGPFDDLCGALASSPGADRVVVLLKLLSGETKVTLRRDQLIAA
ncbi:transcription termination/antitermination protein NusG [Sphingomicrobium astaxanthinifaciens]|uniref:transcription termination/antitermination protein NusG n=1 Tax=Sphingomicrobium astaxanthinifaciens TaxID=1227949 RepID=UPI001FCB8687|nr:transcription termination/antitermination NusG family protein [Sphingomicrobium astaxanthinifaciens]MCJ7420416.1 hypothetical protein [Sphingomicrobium astaxanthinifaciens]